MSSRKRLSLGSLRGKPWPAGAKAGGKDGESKSSRRSSLSSWAFGISGALNRSLQTAAATADRFERRLFPEYDEQGDDDINDIDAYGALCAQRGQEQRAEFETRYKHLVETLGDLGLAADIDPDSAAALLDDSQATADLDTMLALLRAEERQNSRAEHSRSCGSLKVGGGGNGTDEEGGAIGADLLAAPCLEFLLEERVVKVLCEMSTADRPAGTLALVLGAMASLLGQVSHPLLPSQAVHDPIAKLVSAAGAHGRRSGGAAGNDGGTGKGGHLDQTAPGSARRRMLSNSSSSRATSAAAAQARARARVQANLARLLGAIWRKLREESALLDFFLRHEGDAHPGSSGIGNDGGDTGDQSGAAAATGATPCALRLDVFDRLLPLLELPGMAGRQAREACLVALSVKDPRVGEYVAERTELCAQLAQTLTARYLALYDTLEELQVAAALPVDADDSAGGGGTEPGNGSRGAAGLSTRQQQRQSEHAEATFNEALSLFLQHLRFCNAVGLVATDTQACLRPPAASYLVVDSGGGSSIEGAAKAAAGTASSADDPIVGEDDRSETQREIDSASTAMEAYDGVSELLASQVRQLLLSNAIGPALTSALESRARWTTTIVVRAMAELLAGVEGYGVAVAGLAASVGDGSAGRRQLGPLVDTVSAFLVGREGSGSGGVEDSLPASSGKTGGGSTVAPPPPPPGSPPPPPPPPLSSKGLSPGGSGSMVLMTSRSSGSTIVCLRDVLLRRLQPSSPPQLRVSTLELLSSLAELRDDRVFLDLVLCPEKSELTPTRAIQKVRPGDGEAGDGRGGPQSIEALLDASPGRGCGGPLEGVRVSRAMVDSFGSAFGGSPIHPNFRLFSASSHLSLEGYLVAAHQRQIQQLMEGTRGSCQEDEKEGRGEGGAAGATAATSDKDMVDIVVGGDGGKVLQAVAAVAVAAASGRNGSATNGLPASRGGEGLVEFDAAGFVREYGEALARGADAEGSFLHALFDCLEDLFERTLEENLAVTGVLSSLCLAATAAEISPVRRLLLILLFDGTPNAPFRSMRRILEKLWGSAQERVASLPNAPRMLSQARASLGMDPVGATGSVAGVPGGGGGAVVGGGGRRQGSRGMREELGSSKRR
ncbi:unnamed protein product, partial [Hapterophycus canaliculatus]